MTAVVRRGDGARAALIRGRCQPCGGRRGRRLRAVGDELARLESGYGKDKSLYALEDYTDVKHVMVSLD